jgi:hypothetical protein
MLKTEFDMDSISLEPYSVDDKSIAVTPRMVCEILIVLYVLVQAYDELAEIKESGLWEHFWGTGGFWNVVDALRIAMFTISIIGYLRILFDSTGWNLELPLPPGQIYVDFANLSEASGHYVLSCSISIVLCLLSVMKYIRHSQAYGLLIITLQFAGPEIFRFMVRVCRSYLAHPSLARQCVIVSVFLLFSVRVRSRTCGALLFSGDVLDRQSDLCRNGPDHVRQHIGGVQHAVEVFPDPGGGMTFRVLISLPLQPSQELHSFGLGVPCICVSAHVTTALHTDDDDDWRIRIRINPGGVAGLCGHLLYPISDPRVFHSGQHVVSHEIHSASLPILLHILSAL